MEWRKITLLLLLINTICLGQEICNNAIDDDGDGHIDINDIECICTGNAANNTLGSLIPNASFEDYSTCPDSPSQLNLASNWQQCTSATADYMNTCGYIFEAVTTAGLNNFPDGNGIAGIIITPDFKEYLGTNLSSTLYAGKSYSLSFSIASLPVNGDGNTCNNGTIDYSSISITLYGSTQQANFPLNTTGTPTSDSQWMVVGSAIYQPAASWGTLTISFIPSVNINSIMLGAPETLAPSYSSTSCYPYFMFDGLAMTEASAITASITPGGTFCDGNLTLHANTTVTTQNTTYQWYKEGAAIIGAVGSTLPIPPDVSRLGNYSVKINSGDNCVISDVYSVIQYMPEPVVAQVNNDCQGGTATIILQDTANQYSFDNGATWTENPASLPLQAGTYNIIAKSNSGCISQAITVTIDPYAVPAPVAEEVQYVCQYSNAEPLRAIGENILWYNTPTGGTGTATAPKPATETDGIQVFYASQTVNGCESERIPVSVIVNPTPRAPQVNTPVVCYYNNPALPLYAHGESLTWYDAEGRILTSAPVPNTSVTGSVTYFVSQTVNGCESEKAAIKVEVLAKEIAINYPKFFTPNGDGVHEQWNISPLDNNIDAEIVIFDRNGQYITSLKPQDRGWDGTLNGRPLPANDYWFRVAYTEFGTQKEFMSHFSLVR